MGDAKITAILVNKDSLFNQSTIRNRIKGRYSDCFDQCFTFLPWCASTSNTIRNATIIKKA